MKKRKRERIEGGRGKKGKGELTHADDSLRLPMRRKKKKGEREEWAKEKKGEHQRQLNL